jgi:hypothetical protein
VDGDLDATTRRQSGTVDAAAAGAGDGGDESKLGDVDGDKDREREREREAEDAEREMRDKAAMAETMRAAAAPPQCTDTPLVRVSCMCPLR